MFLDILLKNTLKTNENDVNSSQNFYRNVNDFLVFFPFFSMNAESAAMGKPSRSTANSNQSAESGMSAMWSFCYVFSFLCRRAAYEKGAKLEDPHQVL